MMLCGEDDVLCACFAENGGPLVRDPLRRLAIEDGSEVVVAEIPPEVLAMVCLRRRARDTHHVEIPLGVRIIHNVVGVTEVVFGMGERRPARDRIETVMDEDA